MLYERINSTSSGYDYSIESEPPTIIADSNRRKILATLFILLSSLTQFICFYGIGSILRKYLTESPYHWEVMNANIIESVYCTNYMLMALIGGLLADFLFHRIILLCFTFVCYLFGILGLVLLKLNTNQGENFSVPVLCSCEAMHRKLFIARNVFITMGNVTLNATAEQPKVMSDERCASFIFVMVYLIGLGSGVSRVISSVIGADQVRSFGSKAVSIYFLVNCAISQLGLIVANWVMFSFDDRVESLIFVGAMLILSGFFMVAGMPFYKLNKMKASLCEVRQLVKEIHQQTKKREAPKDRSISTFIQNSKQSNGGKMKDKVVEGFLSLMKILVFFWLIIPFSMLQRTVNLMDLQSLKMKYPFPICYQSTIYTFESAVMILIAIVMILGIIRFLSRDQTPSYFWRIFIGSVSALMAVFFASIIEHFRIDIFWGYQPDTLIPAKSSFNQTNGYKDYNMVANLSVLWMTAPYFFLALSETLVFPTVLEYSYLNCPPWYQCTGSGLLWAAWGVGSLLDNPFAYNGDGIIYDMMNINRRKAYPCINHSWFKQQGKTVCWHSRLDYLYYMVLCTVSILWVTVNLLVLKFCPSVYQPSYIGLDDSIFDAEEEAIEE